MAACANDVDIRTVRRTVGIFFIVALPTIEQVRIVPIFDAPRVKDGDLQIKCGVLYTKDSRDRMSPYNLACEQTYRYYLEVPRV